MRNVGGFVSRLRRPGRLWILSGLVFIGGAGQGLALNKPSLQSFSQELKGSEEIRALFKTSQNLENDPSEKLAPLLKVNSDAFQRLLKEFEQSSPFVRGEIEDEKVLSSVMTWLQLSLIKTRSDSFQQKWNEVQKDFAGWFLFAADFPYEESSLIGLRTTSVVRSLLLDELEKIQTKFANDIGKTTEFRQWFVKVRAPWPVDRVMITEAKRLLKPPLMSVANASAKAFQKNPYQTSAQALAHVKGGQSQGAELLKQIWREADIQMMKSEISRIGKLQVRLAKAEYEQKQKKSADSVQDLVKAGLLDKVPIDYLTGKPLDLTSL
jgi:hypothetical protein